MISRACNSVLSSANSWRTSHIKARSKMKSILVIFCSSPSYKLRSVLSLFSSTLALLKWATNASKFHHKAETLLKLEATHLVSKILPILKISLLSCSAWHFNSLAFLGDWWYSVYSLSINDLKWFTCDGKSLFITSDTESSNLWLAQCQN